MRIVALSDTHTKHDQVTVPDGDVLVFAGDATFRGRAGELDDFCAWWLGLPHKHKLFCPGNHDVTLESDFAMAMSRMRGVKVCIDEAVVIESVKFYLSPYTPVFFDWAFMKDRGQPIKAVWDKIPLSTNVLVTHGPPYGILDLTPRGEHAGCEELLAAVKRVNPDLCVFGHIHQGYGVKVVPSDWSSFPTTFANVSACNEAYQIVNAPFVFDL